MNMRNFVKALFVLLLCGVPAHAHEVIAEGTLHVSTGKTFAVRLEYRDPHNAVYDRRNDSESERYVISQEGIWHYEGGKPPEKLPDAFAAWVFGHEFFAQILYFDEVNGGSLRRDERRGDRLYDVFIGRQSALNLGIENEELVVDHATGLADKLMVNTITPLSIVTTLSDWRTVSGHRLPFRASMFDGKRMFDFQFSRVSVRN